jgi:hypothetical protein
MLSTTSTRTALWTPPSPSSRQTPFFIALGHSAVAGTHRGRDGIRQFFERLYELAGGSLVIVPAEVLSNDDQLVLFLRFTGQRDGQTLDVTVAGFHSDHGPDGWRRATFLPDDVAAFDRFFTA